MSDDNTHGLDADIQDLLIDSLNDHETTMNNVGFVIKSYRAEEVSKFRNPRIYVDFHSEFEPTKRFLGDIVGRHEPQKTIWNGKEITVAGKPAKGFPCKTMSFVSVIANEKRAHGYDANKLCRKVIGEIIIKIHSKWPKILHACRGDLEGPIGPIRSEPFFVGSQKTYRYTVRFDIMHTFIWTEPDKSTDGYIFEISGGIYDARQDPDVFILEFNTER